jgi:cellulose synthase/poly-beta-1,6-N-acetylglucosamine synthase-like glycosyltransferase/exo-beta-1,3-glucanase (GH17 family)
VLRLTNIIIGIAVAIISISLWAYINRPQQHPGWPKRVMGFAFSPYRANQDPRQYRYPTLAQIEEDLKLLSGKANAIRTYSVEDDLAAIPQLARKYNLNVCLGAYLSSDEKRNAWEFPLFLNIARSNPNVVRAIVGNETLYHNSFSRDDDANYKELLSYLDKARKVLRIPVSTAEPAYIWAKKYPDLVNHVDFIAVQILPYWEGRDAEKAVDYAFDIVKGLRQQFPGKPIIISEIGWPSNGRTRLQPSDEVGKGQSRQEAVASVANQAIFLRNFLARAPKEGYVYYIMEAFDQPWKTDIEGSVGAYWGVYDVDRHPKFTFTQPIVPVPQWQVLAGISIVLAVITFALLLIDSKTLRGHARSFLAVVSYFAATAVVWIVYDYSSQYLTIGSIIIGLLLVIGMVGILAVLLAEAHEWAEALWVKQRRRAFVPVQLPDDQLPRVSIHVPAYNEPPDMLAQTLQALAQLDYPDYEVIVIDNNTKDPAVWQPIEALCKDLGERFRFFHVDPLAGFKAGALNFALRHTDPAAQIVAVIDSDYIVDPNWLRDLAPQFSNNKVAIVQAPQDYRDFGESVFKAMCFSEYRGFFFIGMITRNERNAIIQHGTMTMVRKSVLEKIGGWGEWCITEDAELGLRIFEQGHEAIYISQSYGRGLMPDTFNDYKKQRYRWAYGAVQILKQHWRSLLLGDKNNLTYGQRYHFMAGWLPWIADGVNLIFTIAAICWSAAMMIEPTFVDPPLVIFAILPLSLFCFKIAKIIYLYRTTVHASLKHTISAAWAGLALSHTIAVSILEGFITKNKPFFRTPKLKNPSRLLTAIVDARWEWLFALGLWASAIGVRIMQPEGGLDLQLWMLLLVIQSLPYVAAIVMAIISGLPGLPVHHDKDAVTPQLEREPLN